MKLIYLFSCLLLLVPACKKKHAVQINSNDPLAEAPGPTIQLNHFPLKTGNMWVYDNGDTLRAIADTVINGMAATKLVRTSLAGAHTSSYYANKPDGLYLVGSDSRPYRIENPFGSLQDSLVIFSTPLLLVRYPINFHEEWNVADPEHPYARRNWVTFSLIKNKAGTFNCASLKTTDQNISEYYSEKGLIRAVAQPICITSPCPPIATNLVYVNF